MSLNFKYIHTDYLLEISEQNTDFIAHVVSIFFEETPVFLNELFVAAEAHNVSDVRRIRHTLRSSFAIIGISELCKESYFLSTEALSDQTCTQIIANREKIIHQFNCICDELRTFTESLR
ncbi:MAG: Hpt domain-containing protein [Bacteroidales bacterium]